ncbi:MAG: biotin/lipoyl-binding protein [Clostridia bacterium]|nr:biotin/lipoyl-binding protein [Clostridia bacterium]
MKYQVTLNGKTYEVDVTETDAVITSVTQAATPAPEAPAAPVAPAPAAAPIAAAAPTAVAGEKIISPMPGNILAVKAVEGQSVKTGDVLFILEAMKMENEIVAPHDGTVKQVLVAKGATVNTDDVLAVI